MTVTGEETYVIPIKWSMWQARSCMNPFSHKGISYVKVLVKQISTDSNMGLSHAVIVLNMLHIGIKYSCQADIFLNIYVQGKKK